MSKIVFLMFSGMCLEFAFFFLVAYAAGLVEAFVLLLGSLILGLIIVSVQRRKLNLSAPGSVLRLIYLTIVFAFFMFPGLLSDVIGYLMLIPGIYSSCEKLLQRKLDIMKNQSFNNDNFTASFFHYDNFSSSRPSGQENGTTSGDNVVDAAFTVVDEDAKIPSPKEGSADETAKDKGDSR